MRVRPYTITAAKTWNAAVHRRLKAIQGGRWAVAATEGDQVIGVAIVGNAARMLGPWVLAVLRVAVEEGHPNACSMLYGACSRAARDTGADGLVTYTHQDEPGTSLIAAGWVCDGLTSGGEHGREGRPRKPVIDASPKFRWWAPWSEKAKEFLARERGRGER